MAWTYVRALPTWDEISHNVIRKDCFKVLTINAKSALKIGGMKIGTDRITSFRSKLKTMSGDYEDIGKCQEALNFLKN
jgi:Cut8, nuclear proteasome tether protein